MDRKANTLTHTTILTSANRTSLHVSTVDHYYYMPFAYRSSLTSNWFNPYNYQYYQQHQSQYILLGTVSVSIMFNYAVRYYMCTL